MGIEDWIRKNVKLIDFASPIRDPTIIKIRNMLSIWQAFDNDINF